MDPLCLEDRDILVVVHEKIKSAAWTPCVWKTGTSWCKRLSSPWNFSLIWQVRFKLGSSDDEEDEEDSGERPHSEQDLCHPLCQCDKCSKWQKVSGNVNKKTKAEFL